MKTHLHPTLLAEAPIASRPAALDVGEALS
jgi:hypothetical protein